MSEHAPNTAPVLPTNWDQCFPGRFVKAGELTKPVTLTVQRVYIDTLPNDDGKQEKHGIIRFNATRPGADEKELRVNSTNRQILQAMFGKDPQALVGKRITIACEPDYFGRDKVDAVRVVGSPDLAADLTVVVKLPRKSPKTRTVTRT